MTSSSSPHYTLRTRVLDKIGRLTLARSAWRMIRGLLSPMSAMTITVFGANAAFGPPERGAIGEAG